jgi:hypothetical protein
VFRSEFREPGANRLSSFRQKKVRCQVFVIDRVESVVDQRVRRFHAAAGGHDTERLVSGGGGNPALRS